MDLIVIGGGLSGLVSAYKAKQAGQSVLLLEAAGRVGGAVRSEQAGEFLLEFGPNTVQIKEDLWELIHQLKISRLLDIASPKTPRYVLFQGKLHPVPHSPLSLITTPLLPMGSILSLLMGLVAGPHERSDDESLDSYIRRRFGNTVAERLAAPFVSGVWAGDITQLSAAAAFPTRRKPKRNHVKGLLISFKNGMDTLTKSLSDALSNEIKLNVPVKKIQRRGNEWEISGDGFTHSAKQLTLSTPAPAAAKLVMPFAPEAARALEAIPYAPLAVLHLGFKRDQVSKFRPGFGFLCAPSEKSDILGCLWNSNLFKGRAPSGSALWTVYMGGMTNPAVLNHSDEALVGRALATLKPIMGLEGNPTFSRVTRYKEAIPQYTMGHEARIKVLEKIERQTPGLRFAANYRGGISVGQVVMAAST